MKIIKGVIKPVEFISGRISFPSSIISGEIFKIPIRNDNEVNFEYATIEEMEEFLNITKEVNNG